MDNSDVAVTCTVIGPQQGYSPGTDYNFDRVTLLYDTNDTDATATVGLQYLTSRAHASALMTSQVTASAYNADYELRHQRSEFGINGHGFWVRVVAQLAGEGRMALYGWEVLAFPHVADPALLV